MQQVKGVVLKSRLGFVQEHFGAEGVAKVMARLSADDQSALRLVLPVVWYPFPLGERLDDAIVRACGAGDPLFFERLGEASAERNLTSLHKSFLRPGQPHEFLERAPAIYRTYYETGRREYRKTGPQSGVLTTFDAESYSAPDCQTVVGWHRRALTMCGVKGVHVVHAECRARGAAVCRYDVSWAA